MGWKQGYGTSLPSPFAQVWKGDGGLACRSMGCPERARGREHSVTVTSLSREVVLPMCISALFLRPEMAMEPPVLGAHSVASCKLLQLRPVPQIQFNKHVLSGTVTGGRVGTQDARDLAPPRELLRVSQMTER